MAQLVAHSLWERGVASSSLAAPTKKNPLAKIFPFKLQHPYTDSNINFGVLSMTKKHILIALIALSIPSLTTPTSLSFDTLLANPEWYKEQAKQWVNMYLLSVPPQDLCLTANVLLYSWAQAQANVETQPYIQSGLQTVVEAAHVFDKTRLTPGEYFTMSPLQTIDIEKLNWALKHHEIASKTYHQALLLIIEKEALSSINAQEAIKQIQANARTAVAQGVASIVRHFDTLITKAHSWLEAVVKILFKNKPIDAKNSKGILKALWQYIEGLLAKAFIASDSIYSTAWYDSAQALLIPHDLHNALWDVMERVRAAFYRAHYEALYEYMQESGIAASCLIKVDESGWVQNPTNFLPDPHSLL